MSVRAVVIGLIGAVFVGATGYFNDIVIHQTFLYNSYMPLFTFGVVILFVVLVNPGLFYMSKRLALSGREIAFIIAIILPSCAVSSRNLIHHFTSNIMSPRYHYLTDAGWREHELIDRVPQIMFAGVKAEYSDEDVLEVGKMCERLTGPSDESRPAEEALRSAFSPRDREALTRALAGARDDPDSPGRDRADVVARALNGVLPRADLFAVKDLAEDLARNLEKRLLPEETTRFLKRRDRIARASAGELLLSGEERAARENAALSAHQVRRMNRRILDTLYADELVSFASKEDRAVKGFQLGLSEGTEHVAFSDVPWSAWGRTMLFWIPLLLSLSAIFVGLALVAHRRWSEHEHYPYPIVTFARALLPEEGRPASGLLKNRMFWVATIIVAAFHVNNYAYMYHHQYLFEIPLRFDFRSLTQFIPALGRGGDQSIMNPRIWFTAIGLAYFIANDVSLSMGLAPFVFAIVGGIFAGYGIALGGGGVFAVNVESFMKAGAYIGMFFIVIYTGRHHYLSVFRKGLFLKTKEDVRAHEAWGARIFLVSTFLFCLMLMLVGVQFRWALAYAAVLIMVYVAVGRVVAETGLFLIQPHVIPTALILGFIGARALGPEQALTLFVLGSVVALGTHVNLLPLVDQGLKLAEERPARTASLGSAVFVIALLVAIPVTIYLQYDRGVNSASDPWTRGITRVAYDPIVGMENRLTAQGALEGAGGHSGLGWLRDLSPNWPAVAGFAIVFMLTIGTEAVRLRFPRWPIHPILFMCAAWWHSRQLAVSFLIGWFIKRSIVKYGGTNTYAKFKPLFWGLIAGDMLGGIILTIIGTIYYFATGTPPKGYWVVPG